MAWMLRSLSNVRIANKNRNSRMIIRRRRELFFVFCQNNKEQYLTHGKIFEITKDKNRTQKVEFTV